MIPFNLDSELYALLCMVITVMISASLIASILKYKIKAENHRAAILNLNDRIATWWLIIPVFSVAAIIGKSSLIILFLLISFLALREFVTIIPTTKTDHVSLVIAFLFILPAQYMIIALNSVDAFMVFIPAFTTLLVMIQSSLLGDNKDFVSRVARLQLCCILCIYMISHVPALLMLKIANGEAGAVKLVCFFILVVQLSDICQYCCGKLLGRHPLIVSVSPKKTWEGFIGGIMVAAFIGFWLKWLTPFSGPEAVLISILIGLLGTGGDLVLSSIKRDSGIKDFSELLPGHGGMLDRVDSVCFAAPVFFHIVKTYYTTI